MATASTTVYERLKALQITLPEVPPPVVDGYVAAFVPFVRTGNLVYLSGRLAKKEGKIWIGKLGTDITAAQGNEAARAIAIELLAALQAAPRRFEQCKAHCEAAGAGEQRAGFYGAARGCQRRVRTFSGNLWRAWGTCPQRLWCGTDSIRCVRRDRNASVYLFFDNLP
jgi:hypothetical protein